MHKKYYFIYICLVYLLTGCTYNNSTKNTVNKNNKTAYKIEDIQISELETNKNEKINTKGLEIIKKDLFGFSTEGADATGILIDDQLKYLYIIFYGETGKSFCYYTFSEENIILMNKIIIEYELPIFYEGKVTDIKYKSVTEKKSYIINKELYIYDFLTEEYLLQDNQSYILFMSDIDNILKAFLDQN